MRRIVVLLACVLARGESEPRVNYCGARMCMNTNVHTFCQYAPGPGPSCTGYTEAQLTNEEKSRLLARLNRRRNEAASGHLRAMPSAGDMLKLRWIEELAKEAQLWADRCRPPSSPEERDECRDLYSTSVGQCVSSVVGEAPGLRVESMVDMWYMQSLLYKGNVTSYIPTENDRYFYGDFGQMLWAQSYMVGCGRSRFMIQLQGRLRSVERLVCNISPAGPAPYRALWSPASPATVCPPRSQPDIFLPALCNYHFEIDASDVVNNTMTIEEHVLLNSVLETERNESLFGIGSLDELYLTNLAIVTMENTERSTSLYNSIKKRDIIESIELENYVNVRDKRNDQNIPIKSNNFNNVTRKIYKKKISTVGRPKTYNMEELTDIIDDNKDTNIKIIEDIPKSFNDIYGDYNIVGPQEENETTTTEAELMKNLYDRVITIGYNTSTTIPVAYIINNDEADNKSITAERNAQSLLQLEDLSANRSELNIIDLNKTLISKEQSEDYLTDSETVHHLQQALDRMEHEKQSSNSTSKVRRDLREFPPNSAEYNSSDSTLSPEEEQNKTSLIDRGPMLNLVMKYMPYFKQYEGELLGTANSAGCVFFSVPCLIFVFIPVMISF